MSISVLLIDGSSLAFRAFFAERHILGDQMTIAAGTALFSKWLSGLIQQIKPVYAATAFDIDNRQSENNQLFSSYKKGRTIDPLLKQGFPAFIDTAKMTGSPVIGIPGHEADDVLATLTSHFQRLPRTFSISIISGDKDLLQLVNNAQNTTVLSPINGLNMKTWHEQEVREKFPGVVTPAQVADYKALVGDSSDGYTGISGIGPKAAQLLLEKFASLDNILENGPTDNSLSTHVRLCLKKGQTQGRTAYQLAKLDRQVDLGIKHLSELTYGRQYDTDISH